MPTKTETRSFWKAPSGRLHQMKNCSGGARDRNVAVAVTKDEFVDADRCPCTRFVFAEWISAKKK